MPNLDCELYGFYCDTNSIPDGFIILIALFGLAYLLHHISRKLTRKEIFGQFIKE